MKVVLFCGGQGMRLREYAENVPKPMVPIGNHPILWHIMKYYSYFGHKDFILCLGHQGNVIKEYFLEYNECLSNDFVMGSGQSIELLSSDTDDWRITFVDTGERSSIGERLKAVESHLAEEETFLANYADGLTDLKLYNLIDFHHNSRAVASFLAVPPYASFHAVKASEDGQVSDISPIDRVDVWMNGGYFVLQREIFRYLHEGEDLVLEPFERLISEQNLRCLRYTGFWGCMDTYKERQLLDERCIVGDTPWQVWKSTKQ